MLNIGCQSTRIGLAEYDEYRDYMDEYSLQNLKKRDVVYLIYKRYMLKGLYLSFKLSSYNTSNLYSEDDFLDFLFGIQYNIEI